MYYFKSAKEAYDHIKENANSNDECDINGLLYYGVSTYIFKDSAERYKKVKPFETIAGHNSLFVHFNSDADLMACLEAMMTEEGHLYTEMNKE